MPDDSSRRVDDTSARELVVGHIAKAHGLRGEVIVNLVSNRPERLAEGSVLQTDRGPLTVRTAAPHQHRWRVAFAEIVDRTDAERWHGTELRGLPLALDGELWVHELVGASVVDTAGRHLGIVEAVEANPASDLLVLDDPDGKGDRLIPLVFVVSNTAGTVVVDPPAGLLDGD